MSIERLGNVLPNTNEQRDSSEGTVLAESDAGTLSSDAAVADEGDTEAVEFVRFCYRRRSVAWPELYDEMCAVAARGDYRGMNYEQLERLGIGFALSALPRLAEMVARVIAEERGPGPISTAAVA